MSKIITIICLTVVIAGLVIYGFLIKQYNNTHFVGTTISTFPQTYVLKCDTCKSGTEGLLKREALTYDNIVLIDSIPKGYELDRAYYERTDTFPFWKIVVYNKVKIE